METESLGPDGASVELFVFEFLVATEPNAPVAAGLPNIPLK
jgi:hypothetical protein